MGICQLVRETATEPVGLIWCFQFFFVTLPVTKGALGMSHDKKTTLLRVIPTMTFQSFDLMP